MEYKIFQFIVQNWDTIVLLLTNAIALFVKSPLDRRKQNEQTHKVE